jgi:hypothetical protein
VASPQDLEPFAVRSWRTPSLESDLRALGDVLGDPEEIIARMPERLWLRIDADGVTLSRSELGAAVLAIPASRIIRLTTEHRQPRHPERALNLLDQWALAFTWGMGRTVWPRIVVTVQRDDKSAAELHLPARDTLGVARWAPAFRPRHWPKLKRAQW